MPSIKQAKEDRLRTLQGAYDLITFDKSSRAIALREQFRMAIADIQSGWEHARTVTALARAREIVAGDGR